VEALEVLNELFRHHDSAIIAGGSGLYIRAICEGIDDIPPVDPEIRSELQQRIRAEGLGSLRFELKKLDPLSYRTLDLKNPNRILKALEITMTAGRPYSSFLTHGNKERDFRTLKIGLNLDRELLYERINRRVDDMMEKGLLEEVRSLLPVRRANALNTVGYKELFDYIDGKTSLEQAVSLIKRNTRHYARRQITWFRRDSGIRWFEPGQIREIITFIGEHVDTAL
jgi:tRNA dimethylallyltransferase